MMCKANLQNLALQIMVTDIKPYNYNNKNNYKISRKIHEKYIDKFSTNDKTW